VTAALRKMIDTLVTDLVETTRAAIVASGVDSIEQIRRHPKTLIALSPGAAKKNHDLKRYLHQHLYRHHRIESMKDKARRTMIALFERYREQPTLLPEEHQARIAALGPERVICDYVAGMTDRYALDEHRRLFE